MCVVETCGVLASSLESWMCDVYVRAVALYFRVVVDGL